MSAPAPASPASSAGAPPASRWRFAPPIAVALTVFLASNTSQVASPVTMSHADKVAHALVFGLIATLVVRVAFDERRPLRSALVAIGCASLYGIVDEFHQSFTPGREVDVADWVADTAGATLAVSLYAVWPAWRRLLELPCRRRSSKERGSGIAPSAPAVDDSVSAR